MGKKERSVRDCARVIIYGLRESEMAGFEICWLGRNIVN
jgi:hypothetical protein